MNNDAFYDMYMQDPDEGPKEQPLQLRLAGKANVVTIAGQQIAIPKIDYVEEMERKMTKMLSDMAEMAKYISRLEQRISALNTVTKNANNRIDQDIDDIRKNRGWAL